MATQAVAGMMFQCVFEGCISMQEMEIERRPYHKNCTCALHNSKGGVCANACPQQRNISFPKKQSWTDSSLCMQTSSAASTSSKFSNNSHHSLLDDMSSSTGNRETVNGAHSLSMSHRRYMVYT